MGKIKDLTDMVFGRLTVLGLAEKDPKLKSRDSRWICLCSCEKGSKIIVTAPNLRNGNTSSCGCYNRELVIERNKRYNKYDLSGEFGIGFTNDNREFYFDKDDFDVIKDHCWYMDNNNYVITRVGSKLVLFHRLVMNAKKNEIIDHIFAVNYDNRKSELRRATKAQNCQNSKTPKNNTSGRKGVHFDKRTNKWNFEIWFNGKRERKYGFKTFEEACSAREEAEIRLHGEFRSYEFKEDKS